MTYLFQLIRAVTLLLNLHITFDRKILDYQSSTGIEREYQKRKRKLQQKFPPKRKLYDRNKKLVGKYLTTRPRDHRFSDQRKLRRMYRNC